VRSMSCIESQLSQMGPAIERQLKPVLFLAGSYLPQTWVLQTSKETASLIVEKSGRVRAVAGAAPHPDVTIETDHDRLAIALRTRDAHQVPPGPPPTVTFHTDKGKMAFSFLRSRLGLAAS
jgi:hypothetical protein